MADHLRSGVSLHHSALHIWWVFPRIMANWHFIYPLGQYCFTIERPILCTLRHMASRAQLVHSSRKAVPDLPVMLLKIASHQSNVTAYALPDYGSIVDALNKESATTRAATYDAWEGLRVSFKAIEYTTVDAFYLCVYSL